MYRIWLRAMSGDSFVAITASMGQLTEETTGKSLEELEMLFFDQSEKYKAFFQEHDVETVHTRADSISGA